MRFNERVQFPLLRCIWRDSKELHLYLTDGHGHECKSLNRAIIPSSYNGSTGAFEALGGGSIPSEGANFVGKILVFIPMFHLPDAISQ